MAHPDDQKTFAIPNYGWNEDKGRIKVNHERYKSSPGFRGTDIEREQVENLAALGIPAQDICDIMHIEPQLMALYYANEMKTGAARVNAQVARVALGLALSGTDSDMTKFWLKTRAGFVETKRVEHTGNQGGPIEFAEVKQRVMETLQQEIEDGVLIEAAGSAERFTPKLKVLDVPLEIVGAPVVKVPKDKTPEDKVSDEQGPSNTGITEIVKAVDGD